MNQPTYSNQQEEWLKVLDKGLITIPKNWREEMGMEPGKVVRARRDGNKVIIEPQVKYAPIRTFTDAQIDQWLKDDKLSPVFAKKVDAKIKKLLSR